MPRKKPRERPVRIGDPDVGGQTGSTGNQVTGGVTPGIDIDQVGRKRCMNLRFGPKADINPLVAAVLNEVS